MKTVNAIKTIEKAGLKIERDMNNAKRYFSRHAHYRLAFFDQDGEAICINVTNERALEADSNPMNGNCYTSYPSTMKAALRYIGAVGDKVIQVLPGESAEDVEAMAEEMADKIERRAVAK